MLLVNCQMTVKIIEPLNKKKKIKLDDRIDGTLGSGLIRIRLGVCYVPSSIDRQRNWWEQK